MRIVVIDRTGLIGSKTVAMLARNRHELIATSRRKGINSIIGEGLAAAKTGAQAVIDISDSPSFEDKAGLEFFKTSMSNLLAEEAAVGVRRHVAASIVGIEGAPENGYFRARSRRRN